MEKLKVCTLAEFNKIKGETFFKRKQDAKAVYVINHYNRCDKTYSVENYDNGNEVFLKGSTKVYFGFDY